MISEVVLDRFALRPSQYQSRFDMWNDQFGLKIDPGRTAKATIQVLGTINIINEIFMSSAEAFGLR